MIYIYDELIDNIYRYVNKYSPIYIGNKQNVHTMNRDIVKTNIHYPSSSQFSSANVISHHHQKLQIYHYYL